MKATKLTEIDYIKPWALMTICAWVGGLVIGAVVGGIFGGVMGIMHVPMHTIKTVCGILGFLVGLPVSYLFFRIFVSRMIVDKLTPETPDSFTPVIQPPASDHAKAA